MPLTCPICRAANPDGAATCMACGVNIDAAAEDSPRLPPGTALQQGSYIVERVLGQGGFGITYLATDTLLKRAVCIKEFFPAHCHRRGQTVVPVGPTSAAEFSASRARFIEEAQRLARFSHTGIVDVYTCFEENNSAYMVMEYLRGQTSGALLRERGSIAEADSLHFIARAGEAIEAMHREGMLHRDIKPDNIMLCQDGRVVLVDFGTARDVMSSQTEGHTVAVTPGYAPLEQYARQAQRGAYSDVYALGATLYHLLTGDAPPSATDRATGVGLTPPRHKSAVMKREVTDAVMWAMSMKIDERPRSVREFMDALHGVAKPNVSLKTQLQSRTPVPSDTRSASLETADVVFVNGYYTVRTTSSRVTWPGICVCCGVACDPPPPLPPGTMWSESHRPYCSKCKEHVRETQFAERFLAIGGALIAAVGFVLAMQAWFIYLFMLLVVVGLPFLALVIRKAEKAKALMTSKCQSAGPAGTFSYYPGSSNADETFLYSFKNREAALAFLHVNSSILSQPVSELQASWQQPGHVRVKY